MLTGESRLHISTPLGIWTRVPCDRQQTGSPPDQWDMVRMKWDCRLSTRFYIYKKWNSKYMLPFQMENGSPGHFPCKWKFVVCPFVDEETNRKNPFANRLNGLPIYKHWIEQAQNGLPWSKFFCYFQHSHCSCYSPFLEVKSLYNSTYQNGWFSLSMGLWSGPNGFQPILLGLFLKGTFTGLPIGPQA